MARLSVIMPVYNAEKYVGEAIESVLNQTFQDFEFIIIDDCSLDNSLEIIQSYNDHRIVLLKNAINQGRAISDNIALNFSKGEYIAKMDADDISLPNRFKKQVFFLDNNPSIDIVGSWMKHFGDNSFLYKYPTSPLVAACETLFRIPIGNPTVMFRKSSVEKAGLSYDENIKGTNCEDYDFLAKAFTSSLSMTSLGEVLLMYRVLPITKHKKEIHNLRIKGACKVRESLLRFLNIPYTSEDLELHNKLSIPVLLNSADDLRRSKEWLNKLYFILKGQGYNNEAISICLSQKWFELLYVNSKFTNSQEFLKPFLDSPNSLTNFTKLKFFIKKILNK